MEWNDRKDVYLVTGADGFVGREICAALRAAGERVRGLVEVKRPTVPTPAGVQLVEGDVRDAAAFERLFDGVEPGRAALIHCAAVISVRKRNAYCEEVNVRGTENAIAASLRHGARLVHIASVDALHPAVGQATAEPTRFEPAGLPTSYGRSKAAAAQKVLDAAANDGLDCTVLLPSAVIGPNDYRRGFITQMLATYLNGMPRMSVAGGYEFVDVRDVAAACITAAQRPGRGECYLLSSGYLPVTEVYDTLAGIVGRKPTAKTLPLGVLYPVAPLVCAACRLAGREPPLTTEAVRLLAAHPAYSHEKAQRELGFAPRPLQTSIADAAAFLLSQRGAHGAGKEG